MNPCIFYFCIAVYILVLATGGIICGLCFFSDIFLFKSVSLPFAIESDSYFPPNHNGTPSDQGWTIFL